MANLDMAAATPREPSVVAIIVLSHRRLPPLQICQGAKYVTIAHLFARLLTTVGIVNAT
jgi:hypothetical protein